MTASQNLQNVVADSQYDYESSSNTSHCCWNRRKMNGEVHEGTALLGRPTAKSEKRFYIPARYVLAFWSFLGFVNIFTLRMDINIAILDMAHNDNVSDSCMLNNGTNFSFVEGTESLDNCTSSGMPKNNNMTAGNDWSESRQDMVLSAFFYGYCSTQILGGFLSQHFGGKLVLGLGLLTTSVLNLVIPVATAQSYYLLIVCRVFQGLAQGLAQPCMHTIWSHWAPENEKSKLMTITYSGSQLGTVIANLGSGYLCDLDLLGGWPLVFYIFGGCGVLWSISWLVLIHDKPSQHPRISEEERRYIEENITHNRARAARPSWRYILTSPALYAIIASHFANDWGCFALTTCLPKYMKSILNFEITQNGLLSSLPYIVLIFTNPLSGYIADKLRSRRILSTKNTRKLVNSIGLFIPSALMLAVCFADQSRTLIVTFITLALGISGFTMAGYSVNHLDIAPSFAGVLFGLTNTIGTTTGFLGPAILAALTEGQNNSDQWKIFFYLTSAIFFVGALVFLIFAQGEPQNWWPPGAHENDSKNINNYVTDNVEESKSASPSSHYTIQDEDTEDDVMKSGNSNVIYDDVDWESLLVYRRAESAIRHEALSSFSQILQSY